MNDKNKEMNDSAYNKYSKKQQIKEQKQTNMNITKQASKSIVGSQNISTNTYSINKNMIQQQNTSKEAEIQKQKLKYKEMSGSHINTNQDISTVSKQNNYCQQQLKIDPQSSHIINYKNRNNSKSKSKNKNKTQYQNQHENQYQNNPDNKQLSNRDMLNININRNSNSNSSFNRYNRGGASENKAYSQCNTYRMRSKNDNQQFRVNKNRSKQVMNEKLVNIVQQYYKDINKIAHYQQIIYGLIQTNKKLMDVFMDFELQEEKLIKRLKRMEQINLQYMKQYCQVKGREFKVPNLPQHKSIFRNINLQELSYLAIMNKVNNKNDDKNDGKNDNNKSIINNFSNANKSNIAKNFVNDIDVNKFKQPQMPPITIQKYNKNLNINTDINTKTNVDKNATTNTNANINMNSNQLTNLNNKKILNTNSDKSDTSSFIRQQKQWILPIISPTNRNRIKHNIINKTSNNNNNNNNNNNYYDKSPSNNKKTSNNDELLKQQGKKQQKQYYLSKQGQNNQQVQLINFLKEQQNIIEHNIRMQNNYQNLQEYCHEMDMKNKQLQYKIQLLNSKLSLYQQQSNVQHQQIDKQYQQQQHIPIDNKNGPKQNNYQEYKIQIEKLKQEIQRIIQQKQKQIVQIKMHSQEIEENMVDKIEKYMQLQESVGKMERKNKKLEQEKDELLRKKGAEKRGGKLQNLNQIISVQIQQQKTIKTRKILKIDGPLINIQIAQYNSYDRYLQTYNNNLILQQQLRNTQKQLQITKHEQLKQITELQQQLNNQLKLRDEQLIKINKQNQQKQLKMQYLENKHKQLKKQLMDRDKILTDKEIQVMVTQEELVKFQNKYKEIQKSIKDIQQEVATRQYKINIMAEQSSAKERQMKQLQHNIIKKQQTIAQFQESYAKIKQKVDKMQTQKQNIERLGVGVDNVIGLVIQLKLQEWVKNKLQTISNKLKQLLKEYQSQINWNIEKQAPGFFTNQSMITNLDSIPQNQQQFTKSDQFQNGYSFDQVNILKAQQQINFKKKKNKNNDRLNKTVIIQLKQKDLSLNFSNQHQLMNMQQKQPKQLNDKDQYESLYQQYLQAVQCLQMQEKKTKNMELQYQKYVNMIYQKQKIDTQAYSLQKQLVHLTRLAQQQKQTIQTQRRQYNQIFKNYQLNFKQQMAQQVKQLRSKSFTT